MSTIKSLSTKAKKSRVGWLVALGGAVAAAVAAAVYLGDKSAKAPAGPPGPAPANTVPVWTQLTPVANPQLAGTFMVTVPTGASFAFADGATDPNLSAIVSGLNAAAANGTINGTQSFATGNAAPSWWPADGFGTNGYRASGVAVSPFTLVLGPLTGSSPATTPAVWIATSYTSA